MKRIFIVLLLSMSFMLWNCKEKDTAPEREKNGLIHLKGLGYNETYSFVYPLGHFYPKSYKKAMMHTLDFLINIRNIWVSQDSIIDGDVDNLHWIKLYEGDTMRYFSQLDVPNIHLPVGKYQSFKFVWNNVFYRKACFANDTSKIWLMKETMGNWTDGCNDTLALGPTNYLTSRGLFYMNATSNKLFLAQPNEKIKGFEIKEGKLTSLYWKLGDERPLSPYACSFEFIDENNNGLWDCATDRMDNFQCDPAIDPPVKSMFTFIPVYE